MRKILIVVILLALVGVGWWVWRQGVVVDYFEPDPFSPSTEDTISSWKFQGSHNDNGPLEARVGQEIERLTSLLGTNDPESPDYALYVGISNQYVLLGEGEEAYNYLLKALKIDSQKTGLAWHNMGTLMERLGAYTSARTAYARAVEAQPQVDGYHVARLQFLTNHFADDIAAIEGAFSEAESRFGSAPFLLTIKAEWYEETKRTAEAITTLEAMRALIPEEERAALDVKIGRLKSAL